MMTMNEIRQANRAAGYHFFDADTLRFFDSVVFPRVYGDGYFVTQEQAPHDHYPRYTVRKAEPDGSISTVGDGFYAYETPVAAEHAAIWLASERS